MSAKITLGPSETFTESRDGKTLRRYPVLADGDPIGTVSQHRVETVATYSSRMYGYARTRTCWQWQSVDNAGDGEFATRKDALADMEEYATTTGLIMSPEARYAEQVTVIEQSFEYEYCEECGYDIEDHTIAPDPLGNAHAYCTPTLERLALTIVVCGRGTTDGLEAHEEIKRRILDTSLTIEERRAAFRAHNRITGNGEVHGAILISAPPTPEEQWLYGGNHERLVNALTEVSS